MFPNVTYDEFSIATEPDDVVIFVSDGILDAENEGGEMYGEERLAPIICGHRNYSAAQIADAVLADVTRFQDGKDRFDDETIIVLKVR
jgi:sigma-B regulation protein RsbU (phosphoserine phosphatase)